eukprot:gene2955-3770_t
MGNSLSQTPEPFLLFTGGFTQLRQADPFLSVGGIEHDTSKFGKGISIFGLTKEGAFVQKGAPVWAGENPSFLCLDPRGRFLYTTNETTEFEGKKDSGGVRSFRIQPSSSGEVALELLSAQPSLGSHPCMIATDKRGARLFVANYSGGSISLVPIKDDGRLAESRQLAQYQGASVDPARQLASHAHSVAFAPNDEAVFVCDLGTDKVMQYSYDTVTGTWTPNNMNYMPLQQGLGPRHLVFHPTLPFAYVVCELAAVICVYRYNSDTKCLVYHSSCEMLPSGWPSEGGELMVVTNQHSHNMVSFHVDRATGILTPTGHQIEVPLISCVRIVNWKDLERSAQ